MKSDGRGKEKMKLTGNKKKRMVGSLLKEEELPILCDSDSGIVYFSDGENLFKLSNQDRQLEDKTIEQPNLQQIVDLEMHLNSVLKMIRMRKNELELASSAGVNQKDIPMEEHNHGDKGKDEDDNISSKIDD